VAGGGGGDGRNVSNFLYLTRYIEKEREKRRTVLEEGEEIEEPIKYLQM
jgi:hypothetical protein